MIYMCSPRHRTKQIQPCVEFFRFRKSLGFLLCFEYFLVCVLGLQKSFFYVFCLFSAVLLLMLLLLRDPSYQHNNRLFIIYNTEVNLIKNKRQVSGFVYCMYRLRIVSFRLFFRPTHRSISFENNSNKQLKKKQI